LEVLTEELIAAENDFEAVGEMDIDADAEEDSDWEMEMEVLADCEDERETD